MKTLGIVGGIGPASTVDYYNGIIEKYRLAAGDSSYPQIIINSIDMTEMVKSIEAGRFDSVGKQIGLAIQALEMAGADYIGIASNSPHIAWREIMPFATVPVISLVDQTCNYILNKQYKNVLIFATKFTMKNGLYSSALSSRSIGWTLPEPEDIETVGNIIFPNLENGLVLPEEKKKMIAVAEKYIARCGCDSLLLGCTEVPLMIKSGDVSVPVINTTQIHIDALTDFMLR